MTRAVWYLCLLAVFGLGLEETCQAGPMSLQNPYRSFNLSGINYGAEQWERDHARSQIRNATPVPPVMNRVVHRRRRHR